MRLPRTDWGTPHTRTGQPRAGFLVLEDRQGLTHRPSRALVFSCSRSASSGGESFASHHPWHLSRPRPGRTCGARPGSEREGEDAHPLLAQDRLAPLRARHAHRDPAAKRPGGAGGAGLHHLLEGDGAGGQQGSEGKAAADREDDGAPLPLLRGRACGPGCREAAGREWASSAAAGRSTRSGATSRSTSKSFRKRYGINNRTAADEAPTWTLVAMVMNHYKRPKSFYVRTQDHVHHRAAPVDLAGDHRQVQPGAQRDGLRRARRRQARFQLRRPERLGRAVLRPAARGLEPSARRRQVPHADEPHLRAAAVQGARLPRDCEARLQHDPADSSRARADSDRLLRHDQRGSRS